MSIKLADAIERFCAIFGGSNSLSKFDPNQARDDSGRWVSGGGGASAHGKISQEGTAAWAQEQHESGKVPDGWYVHGRHGSQELPTDTWIETTQDWGVAEQYASREGSIWMLRPQEGDIVDLEDANTKDMDRIVAQAKEDYHAGNLPFSDDIEGSLGVDDLTDDQLERVIRRDFAPNDIVTSAGAFDNPQWVEWFCNVTEKGFVKLPNGGGVVLDRDVVQSVKVPRDSEGGG